MKAPTRSWGELCTYGVPKEEVLRKVTKILERSHEPTHITFHSLCSGTWSPDKWAFPLLSRHKGVNRSHHRSSSSERSRPSWNLCCAAVPNLKRGGVPPGFPKCWSFDFEIWMVCAVHVLVIPALWQPSNSSNRLTNQSRQYTLFKHILFRSSSW
jgi:hypothetical protein